MSGLESEAESARRMKEAKYEQFALDLFGECYSNSEDRAYALLVRRTRCWNQSTVLNLATEADAKCFFAHNGVQGFLTKIWWGAMTTDTSISKLVLSFFCPPLIWTNLIKFSDEELDSRGGGEEQYVELDSLDTEKALLLTDNDPLDPGGPPGGMEGQSSAAVWWRFLLRRWRRFWSAPVTVFLGNVIMYFAFLILFTYVLLLDFRPPPPAGPGAPEIMLYFWVFTLVLEELRQSFFTDEDMSILKKFKLYVEDNWNKCDMVAISLFVIGVSCRMMKDTYEAGRTVLALDFMVFTLRLIHIFAIHKQLGPKIIIVERMMKDVFFFLFFLSVWLIAYGVATQALLHPNDPRLDWVFRRVLYRPYLHIFGQIPLEEIDVARMPETNCTTVIEEIIMGTLPPCPNIYANWLVILLLVIFLLVTNVLLLNLLIAMFSYTFQVVQGNTDIFWKFQRYNLIVEYHSRPALAPPFIIISHCSQLLLSLVKSPEPKLEQLERELPAGLDQRLMTWETVQKENYLAKLERQHLESSEERLKSTSSKVQSLLKIVGGFKEQEKRMSSMEAQVKYCGEVLSWIAECFSQSTLKCEREAPRVPSVKATGVTAVKAGASRDPPQNVSDKEVEPERREAKLGPSGYGANKRFPYIDQ
uniref:transient receptor potential cation channel subfamily M member 5-like n=1 Tax=Oncorhynchus gorbuscha TaxID=8017 RepID=UPI001EAF16D4|nr:transient receptor potential cation channel subfamily M member 5-like [Oncorhynchus gorbuscha]